MTEKSRSTPSSKLDPEDDAPELDEEFFEQATYKIGERIVTKEEWIVATRQALREQETHSAH